MPPRAAIGDVIGGFRLDAELPAGGQAELWRVSRAGFDFPLLMKIPRIRGGEDPLTIVAFETEQMILPRLSGPHVPRYVASGDFHGPYIVMEFIEGASLKTLLPKLPLPAAEVARLGSRIAAALHDIHGQHVIHLDLKPSNIMLRPSGEVVLIDFGLARHEQLPDLPAEEFDGPFGTGAYIAPEQLLDIRGDPRSDIFALGVILYFFSTGERPFGDPSALRQWRRRLFVDPLPPGERIADYPPWLQEIVLHCLERDPAARYQSAAHVAFDLEHPSEVMLGERATRRTGSGSLAAARRWLRQFALREDPLPQMATRQRALAPIVVAAVDVMPGNEKLADALREEARRILGTAPAARLACVHVQKLARLALDQAEDEEGRNIHLQRLAALQHWAHPLGLPPGKATFHVIEATDPASALIDFASRNFADHIIMGARGASRLRRYLGSVSARVVAEAPCSVTVVRTG
jgi:nucleotide-binding universal stress UspA family protein